MASKHMPMGSLIIGIDLVPIRAIRGCRSIVGDITTQKARDVSTGKLLPHCNDGGVECLLCFLAMFSTCSGHRWTCRHLLVETAAAHAGGQRLAECRVCVPQQGSSEAVPAVQNTGRIRPKCHGSSHHSDVDCCLLCRPSRRRLVGA